MKEWTYVSTYARFSQSQNFLDADNQIFLPFGAPLHVLRYYDKNIQYFESKQQMRYPWVKKLPMIEQQNEHGTWRSALISARFRDLISRCVVFDKSPTYAKSHRSYSPLKA